MTELTDETVKALLDDDHIKFFADRLLEVARIKAATEPYEGECDQEDLASYAGEVVKLRRALLDTRAEHAASLIRINAEAVEAVAQARADAEAAVALALEEAAENKEQLEIWAHEILAGLAFADVLKIDSYNDKIEAHDMVGRGLVEVIRALADPTGVKLLAELRAERDALAADGAGVFWAEKARAFAMQMASVDARAKDAESERDRLAAANAALEAKVAGLSDFIDDFAKAKIDALRYSPPYGSSPEDEPDPVVDAKTVWAWQADAKAALATQEAGNA